jgi:hypothetical protein
MVNHGPSTEEGAKLLSYQGKDSADISTDQRDAAAHHVAWRYDQVRKNGRRRKYSARVKYVHGTEARRLQAELGAVVRNLLTWAAEHEHDEPTEHDKAA